MKRDCACDDTGKLILRFMVGGMMLFHGMHKVFNGVESIGGMLGARGIPAFISWGVYIGEVIAPVLIIIGVMTRFSAGILMFNMIIAVLLVHTGDIFSVTSHGGWGIELQAFYIFSAVAIMMLGPGKFRLTKKAKGFLE